MKNQDIIMAKAKGRGQGGAGRGGRGSCGGTRQRDGNGPRPVSKRKK